MYTSTTTPKHLRRLPTKHCNRCNAVITMTLTDEAVIKHDPTETILYPDQHMNGRLAVCYDTCLYQADIILYTCRPSLKHSRN